MSLDALAYEQLRTMLLIWFVPGKDAKPGDYFRHGVAWPLAMHADRRMASLMDRRLA
jgi:hypothetical protein